MGRCVRVCERSRLGQWRSQANKQVSREISVARAMYTAAVVVGGVEGVVL